MERDEHAWLTLHCGDPDVRLGRLTIVGVGW
jgi:hypothetical protein